MLITLIAAMDQNRLIGKQNQLPWSLSADLRHFRQVTLGKPIIMGRKTFDSIGKPLPGRHNIVISQQLDLTIKDCDVCHSLDAALQLVSAENEVMVIGGAHLFKQSLPIADKMILTIINHTFEGDVYFPTWNKNDWQFVSQSDHQRDEKNQYDYSFLTLRRVPSASRR